MVSITDCVSEGLKYPFKDLKKLLTFGVLFAIINVLSVLSSKISVNSVNNIKIASTNSIFDALSQIVNQAIAQLKATDLYMLVAFTIISFIISLIIMGYQYDIIKFSINRKDDLQEFSDIVGIFVKGIKYFLVCLVYNIIPVILFIVGLQFIAYESYGAAFLIPISGILFIILNFLLIMALTNMIDSDNIADAFAFKEIIGKISNLGWIKYIGILIFTGIIYAIVMIAAGLILSAIIALFAMAIKEALIVSIISGILGGLFISSYSSVFFSRVFGAIYREAIK